MAVSGGYLAVQIRAAALRQIVGFREYIFGEVLPAFGNLDQKANKVADEYYAQVGAQIASEYDYVDMADVADDAQDRAIDFYEMAVSIRQTMLNLLAVGLFHLAEQQLAHSCRDGAFTVEPPQNTQWAKVVAWYSQHFMLDLESLPSWTVMDELRLVANAVKHAEGAATKHLRELRPELFRNPILDRVGEMFGPDNLEIPPFEVYLPLAGEDLFVRDALLELYTQSAESFFAEIADYFEAHEGEYLPR